MSNQSIGTEKASHVNPGVSGEEESINIRDFLALCASKWKWFAFSVCFFMAVAMFFLIVTAPSYQRIATVMIKDEDGGSMTSSIASQFADLGFGGGNADVNNELIAFQSPALLADVIHRLKLDVDYTSRPKFKRVPLYGDSIPVVVTFMDLGPNEGASFTMEPDGKGNLRLDKIKISSQEKAKFEPINVKVGGVFVTPAGRVSFLPGPNYDVANTDKINVKKLSIPAAVEKYQKELDFSLTDDKAAVIDINITDKSIKRAEDLLTTIIEIYNEKWVDDKNMMALTTSQFINDRLVVIEQELGSVDANIADYKAAHLMPDLQAQAAIYLERSNETTKQILDVSTQESIAKYLRDYVEQTVGAGRLLPANSGLDSKGIEAQISDYNRIQLERDNMAHNAGATNPLVKDYDRQLASMRSALIASLDNHIVALRTQLATLNRSDHQTNQQIASSPSQAKYLLSVERQQKIKEELYLFLLQKREENELSRAFTAYNTRIITPAFGNNKPASPNKRNVLILAFLVGMIVPAVVLFVRENMNTYVRNRDDLDAVQAPYMGEIPLSQRLRGSWVARKAAKLRRMFARDREGGASTPAVFVVRPKGRNMINEAFRSLRTNVEFVTADVKGSPVVMSTSFNPGSGKSFIVLNLAAAMAIKREGVRIVAVDLDLRRASLSEAVGNPARGVADYLAGSVDDISKLVVPTQVKGLDLLPVGTIPPNPSELLYSDRLKEVMETLKGHYDYVFIDCPPSEIVTDASIITSHADLTLFVVRAGLLDRRMLPRLNQYYLDHKFNNLCVVLNATKAEDSPYHRYTYSNYYHKEE